MPAMPSVAERSNATLYPSTTADWVQPESRPAEIDGLIAGVGRSSSSFLIVLAVLERPG